MASRLQSSLQQPGNLCAPIIDGEELDWRQYKRLGQGTNGTVYRVTWHRQDGDLQVAAKKTSGLDPNEINILMQLKHKNVIECYGVVIAEPTFMIVMEYAPLGSLDKYLESRSGSPLPQHQIHRWYKNLALAVQYLHSSDFVHRDIKAGNCVISSDMELKLCDFHDARELTVTVSTMEHGSCPWMAPEVMSERKFSKKSDVYSLAVVFWQILTGQVPFADAQNGYQVVWRVCDHKERPAIPHGCPDGIAALLTDSWKSSWSERPAISQVLDRISQLEKDNTSQILTNRPNPCFE